MQTARAIRPTQQKSFLKLSCTRGEFVQIDCGEYGTIAVGSMKRKRLVGGAPVGAS